MAHKIVFSTFFRKNIKESHEYDIELFNVPKYSTQFYIIPRITYTAKDYPFNDNWMYKKLSFYWLIWEQSFVIYNVYIK